MLQRMWSGFAHPACKHLPVRVFRCSFVCSRSGNDQERSSSLRRAKLQHTVRATDLPISRHMCSAAGAGEAQPSRRLFLYSKDDCPLCDGLKEKVQALLDRAQSMPSALSTVKLEIRDITTNEDWWREYSLVIPVLTFADADGSNEVKVPRPSPRISADRLQAHLEKAMASVNEPESM